MADSKRPGNDKHLLLRQPKRRNEEPNRIHLRLIRDSKIQFYTAKQTQLPPENFAYYVIPRDISAFLISASWTTLFGISRRERKERSQENGKKSFNKEPFSTAWHHQILCHSRLFLFIYFFFSYSLFLYIFFLVFLFLHFFLYFLHSSFHFPLLHFLSLSFLLVYFLFSLIF